MQISQTNLSKHSSHAQTLETLCHLSRDSYMVPTDSLKRRHVQGFRVIDACAYDFISGSQKSIVNDVTREWRKSRRNRRTNMHLYLRIWEKKRHRLM
mmetsp:Transcript_41110/g.60887  ORF Transcript_41110/g.60887 Transcript_41110/m.60887 type:complete len:97 (-) Transcript_41110:757-1047(-)